MKTSSAKAKGRSLQKYAAKVIETKCDLEEGDIVSRPMGSGGVDLMASPRARKKFPFSIECKNTKAFPSLAALYQSEANSTDNNLPGVIWKPPGKGMDQSIIYFNFQEFTEFWAEHMGKTDNIDDDKQLYYLSKLNKPVDDCPDRCDNLGRQ